MFKTLVPLQVHNAIEIHGGKQKELVNRQISRLKDSTGLLNGCVLFSIYFYTNYFLWKKWVCHLKV